MVASIATSAFFPASSGKSPLSKTANGSGETVKAANFSTNPAAPSQSTRAKSAIEAVSKVEGYAAIEPDKVAPPPPSTPAPRTIYNQLPDVSFWLATVMAIVIAAADRHFTLPDWRPKRPDMLSDAFSFGKIVQDGLVFKQNFLIRSYEIGADQTASIETLMNHLQETALNHVRSAGLLGDGFGCTPEMTKRNLIWVVSKMQVLVDHYPIWGDIVEVETWVGSHGKNGMRRDWHIRDYNSGQTILRATSLWVMMNKLTRKLAKIPEEVRDEIRPYFFERMAIVDEDNRKFPKLEELNGNSAEKHLRKGLTPRWGDLDVNQHVNNVKYIGWILESAPMAMLEKHELAGMTLEYRRECGKDSVVQSHTTVYSDCTNSAKQDSASIHCEHLLSLESGANIVKARTAWRPKQGQNKGIVGTVSTAHA
ncbi:hypothetical protein LUZ63_015384 [Rhynchospora breviuscula]|uniref:Acyl-[acyl-carrier-protein] hydrolase n=1 Tax=Rhynchospora breviuscula TaxID=2022672 RepID=A0A9Q0HMD3_9POAL|nr:hypothetical protein LUZ63_015384 [Rhynchospora breviuscula]